MSRQRSPVARPARTLTRVALLLGLALGGPALAQDAPAAEEAADELPRDGYTLDTVELTRWSDSEVVVKQLGGGEKVEVVAEQGDHLRVRVGTTFGWVAAALVGSTPPVGEAGAAGGLQLGGMGGLGGLSTPPVLSPPPAGSAPAGD